MNTITRRAFVKATASASLAGLGMTAISSFSAEPQTSNRQFRICLACGPIGVRGNPQRLVEWASQFGFEAIEPSAGFLAKLSDAELQAYRAAMKNNQLTWGAAGLPLEFRGEEAAFKRSFQTLPGFARSLQRAGVTRVATWLSPGHNSLTYVANFRLHAGRLREAARVLGDHDIRLGLEYVGPKTSWTARRFPFIHTMAEMKDLIAEIDRDNVGFLLDSWHWYTARETVEDLLSLRAQDVVLCHLNDAPANVPVEQQIDNRRELPCATGVIDMKGFLGAMLKIGYDGPLVCEPFSRDLRQMPVEQALATVAAAMKKAVALVEAGP